MFLAFASSLLYGLDDGLDDVASVNLCVVVYVEYCFVSDFCTTWNRKWSVSRQTRYLVELLQGILIVFFGVRSFMVLVYVAFKLCRHSTTVV